MEVSSIKSIAKGKDNVVTFPYLTYIETGLKRINNIVLEKKSVELIMSSTFRNFGEKR